MLTAIPTGTRNFAAVVRAPLGGAAHRSFRGVQHAAVAMNFSLVQPPVLVASAQATVFPFGNGGSPSAPRFSKGPCSYPRP